MSKVPPARTTFLPVLNLPNLLAVLPNVSADPFNFARAQIRRSRGEQFDYNLETKKVALGFSEFLEAPNLDAHVFFLPVLRGALQK